MKIEIKNLSKRFGDFTALDNVSLTIDSGELLALLGPSGCGKTTLLRILSGLEYPDSGTILFDGEDATFHSVRARQVGFVFQHYALFRHMTVFENIAFGLRVRTRGARPGPQQLRYRVEELLKLVRLTGLADRYPSQLSGGQRQRVALARALAVQPVVLLLDEPFGALDAKVRQELRQWLRRLHDDIHITSIFVTHDQEEALEVADRVVVMNRGRIEQMGTPVEVYGTPASPFVYDFLGDTNRLRGVVRAGKIELAGGVIELPGADWRDGDALVAYARPHLMMVHRRKVSPVCLTATVRRVYPAGPVVRVELTTDAGDPLVVKLSQQRHKSLRLQSGEAVFVTPGELEFFHEAGVASPA